MIPNRKFVPNSVVARNKETKQYDSGQQGRSHPAFGNPRGYKSCAERRDGPQNEPREFHRKRKIKGDLSLVVVWPQGAQRQIYDGGDKEPGEQGCNDGAKDLEDRMATAECFVLSVWQGCCFHISLVVVL